MPSLVKNVPTSRAVRENTLKPRTCSFSVNQRIEILLGHMNLLRKGHQGAEEGHYIDLIFLILEKFSLCVGLCLALLTADCSLGLVVAPHCWSLFFLAKFSSAWWLVTC